MINYLSFFYFYLNKPSQFSNEISQFSNDLSNEIQQGIHTLEVVKFTLLQVLVILDADNARKINK